VLTRRPPGAVGTWNDGHYHSRFLRPLPVALWIGFIVFVLILLAYPVLRRGRKMLLVRHEPDPRKNPVVRLARCLFPVTDDYVGQRFVVRADGTWMLTPLALA